MRLLTQYAAAHWTNYVGDHARSSDYVFYYNGEEFIVLLVKTLLHQAKMIVDTHCVKSGILQQSLF